MIYKRAYTFEVKGTALGFWGDSLETIKTFEYRKTYEFDSPDSRPSIEDMRIDLFNWSEQQNIILYAYWMTLDILLLRCPDERITYVTRREFWLDIPEDLQFNGHVEYKD